MARSSSTKDMVTQRTKSNVVHSETYASSRCPSDADCKGQETEFNDKNSSDLSAEIERLNAKLDDLLQRVTLLEYRVFGE